MTILRPYTPLASWPPSYLLNGVLHNDNCTPSGMFADAEGRLYSIARLDEFVACSEGRLYSRHVVRESKGVRSILYCYGKTGNVCPHPRSSSRRRHRRFMMRRHKFCFASLDDQIIRKDVA